MKCVIPGANVKVFGRAIHSLSKIGDELYVELLENGLTLRTVNMARSAYSCFNFAPTFFTAYEIPRSSNDDESATLKCKINMKSCVAVFKSLSVLEKTVDKCKVSMHLDEARLIFQLYCHHGIVKTHRLLFIECDTLQAVFAKNLCPNVMTAQTRLFSDAVVNFQVGQEEISVIATPLKLTIKNYVDNEPDAKQAIRTELSLAPEEFDSYTVGVDAEITFCLKEMRAALSFSEASNLPLSLHFESAGKPIIFSIDGDATFEANFVLATLAVDMMPSSQSTGSQQTPSFSRTSAATHRAPTTSVRWNKKPAAVSTGKKVERKSRTAESQGTVMSNRTASVSDVQEATDQELMETFDIQNDTTVIGDRTVHATPSTSTAAVARASSSVNNRTGPARDTAARDTATNSDAALRPANSAAAKSRLFGLIGADSPDKRAAPFTNLLGAVNSSSDDSDGDVDANLVPGTPPSKKFKSMFFGISQSTTSGSQSKSQQPVVLAEDSEED